MESVDLTASQKDYAIFLPAISNAFVMPLKQVSQQPDYYAQSRIPADFEHGVAGLNWLQPKDTYFNYKWSLYSAGHAKLDLDRDDDAHDPLRSRDRASTWLLGDSGGFQIGKGVWPGDWKNPHCPRSQETREKVLAWMDRFMDYGMTLDVPVWSNRIAKARQNAGITGEQDAFIATDINNKYFIENRKGDCKFLNVLQGEHHDQADIWYEHVKHYCDPKQHENHFNGWAMGGQNMCDPHLMLNRIITIIYDGLLEPGKQDHMHFLGTSRLEWAGLLTDVQRAVRKHFNPKFTITFDCASPFLAAANGQIYREIGLEHGDKWTYRMSGGVDDKKYSSDTRRYSDAVLGDKLFTSFEDSPITKRCMIKDICSYAPGQLNRIGKEGRTSWDTLSYAILMSHNTYMHIEAVQRANRAYDEGTMPEMLIKYQDSAKHIPIDSCRNIVDSVFSAGSKSKSLRIIEEESDYWMEIIGSRGFTGKKAKSGRPTYSSFFQEEVNPV